MTHHRKGNEELVIYMGVDSKGNPGTRLRNTVNATLGLLGHEVDEAMQKVFDEVGEEGAARLRERSQELFGRGRHSKYARGWKYERQKRIRGKLYSLIRNTTEPQVAHLLEYGHPIFNQYGATKGHSPAIEHIEPVNQWVQEELVKRFQEELNK